MVENEVKSTESKPEVKPETRREARVIRDAAASISISKLGDDGKVSGEPETFEVPRNTLKIMTALKEHLKDVPDAELDKIRIKVSTKAMDIQPNASLLDAPPREGAVAFDVVMFDGFAKDVIGRVQQMSVPPEYATAALQGFITDPLVGMMECTSLQIAMITVCFEDKGVGGFTVVNNKLPFDPGAAILVAEAASGQLDTFKLEMAKRFNVQFPGDSKIITPGQAGYIPPKLTISGGRR